MEFICIPYFSLAQTFFAGSLFRIIWTVFKEGCDRQHPANRQSFTLPPDSPILLNESETAAISVAP